jgi:hypothetical protein
MVSLTAPSNRSMRVPRPALATAVLASLVVLPALVALSLADPPWIGGVYDDGDHDDLILTSAWGDALGPSCVAAIPLLDVAPLLPVSDVSLAPRFVCRAASPRAPPA